MSSESADEAALLADVLARPDYDAPRRRDADRIAARDPSRAELIEVQCERARLDPIADDDDAAWSNLATRQGSPRRQQESRGGGERLGEPARAATE